VPESDRSQFQTICFQQIMQKRLFKWIYFQRMRVTQLIALGNSNGWRPFVFNDSNLQASKRQMLVMVNQRWWEGRERS
jgi:hypothetical protein